MVNVLTYSHLAWGAALVTVAATLIMVVSYLVTSYTRAMRKEARGRFYEVVEQLLADPGLTSEQLNRIEFFVATIDSTDSSASLRKALSDADMPAPNRNPWPRSPLLWRTMFRAYFDNLLELGFWDGIQTKVAFQKYLQRHQSVDAAEASVVDRWRRDHLTV